ncbi:MAG: hypothetical protein ABEJ72_07600 [Candidatus Aenigmatarchaeota archaeon]
MQDKIYIETLCDRMSVGSKVSGRQELVETYKENVNGGDLDEEGFAEDVVDLRRHSDHRRELDEEINYSYSDRREDMPGSTSMWGTGLMIGGLPLFVYGTTIGDPQAQIIGGASAAIGAAHGAYQIKKASGDPNENLKERAREWGHQYEQVEELESIGENAQDIEW